MQRGVRQGEPMKARTKAYTVARLRHHVVPLLGHKRVTEVGPGEIERFVRDVAAGRTARDRSGRQARAPCSGRKSCSQSCAICRTPGTRPSCSRRPAGGRQSAGVPPSPNSLSTASTPPAKWRKVLPMCPVRSVTYLSDRSLAIDIELRATLRSACCFPTSPVKAGEAWGKRRKANAALLPRTIGGVAMRRCTEPLSSCVRSTTTGLKLSHRIERPVHSFSQGPPTHRYKLNHPSASEQRQL